MKKKLLLSVIIIVLALALCACGSDKDVTASCENGNFVGTYEKDTDVMSFKGIPYAQTPVGELRWKAPKSVEASDETFEAKEYGDSAIQYLWFDENIQTDVSEDCLTLNVWTSDLETKDKAVMVFFHGGAYAWGGSSEPGYDGQYIVDEHEDVVVITANYRIGMMGFIDLSMVEGGEEFPDSRELGLLDTIEALRWVKKNAEAFGGDPDNVTIFGESAGGGIVSALLANECAGDLFQRVICESGNLKMTYTADQFKDSGQAEALLELSGAKNMDDLMALSTEDLIKYNEEAIDEDGNSINDLYNLPLIGGKVIPEDAYSAVGDAAAKGVDLLIGTNADEQNYWIQEMGYKPITELSEEELEENLDLFENYYIENRYQRVANYAKQIGKTADLEEYMASLDKEGVWAKSELATEEVYRQPAIRTAEEHAKAGDASENGGKTYMYYFMKKSTQSELVGSCHAQEIPYVFHNLTITEDYGDIDEGLADDVCEAWTNFAKTGDPSTDEHKWEEYDIKDRKTMVIGDDNSFELVPNLMDKTRQLLYWIVDTMCDTEGV